MSWILEKQIYKDNHWETAQQEFETQAQAENVGSYCLRKGLCEYYEVYHS